MVGMKRPAAAKAKVRALSCEELAFRTSSMTTDDNIKFNAENCDPEDTAQLKAVFADAEMKRLWDRFKTTRHKNPEVEAQYQEVAKLPVRSGKQHAQKSLLMAWLNDPGFGDRYMKMNESVRFSKTTAHQMVQKYGEEEFQQMRDDGLVQERPNPTNPRAKQYWDTTEEESKKFDHSKEAKMVGKKGIDNDEEWLALKDAMGKARPRDQLLKGSLTDLGTQTDDEDEQRRQETSSVGCKGKGRGRGRGRVRADTVDVNDHLDYVQDITKAHLKSDSQIAQALKKFKEASAVLIRDTGKKIKGASDKASSSDVNKAAKFLKQLREVDNNLEDLDMQGYTAAKAQKDKDADLDSDEVDDDDGGKDKTDGGKDKDVDLDSDEVDDGDGGKDKADGGNGKDADGQDEGGDLYGLDSDEVDDDDDTMVDADVVNAETVVAPCGHNSDEVVDNGAVANIDHIVPDSPIVPYGLSNDEVVDTEHADDGRLIALSWSEGGVEETWRWRPPISDGKGDGKGDGEGDDPNNGEGDGKGGKGDGKGGGKGKDKDKDNKAQGKGGGKGKGGGNGKKKAQDKANDKGQANDKGKGKRKANDKGKDGKAKDGKAKGKSPCPGPFPRRQWLAATAAEPAGMAAPSPQPLGAHPVRRAALGSPRTGPQERLAEVRHAAFERAGGGGALSLPLKPGLPLAQVPACLQENLACAPGLLGGLPSPARGRGRRPAARLLLDKVDAAAGRGGSAEGSPAAWAAPGLDAAAPSPKGDAAAAGSPKGSPKGGALGRPAASAARGLGTPRRFGAPVDGSPTGALGLFEARPLPEPHRLPLDLRRKRPAEDGAFFVDEQFRPRGPPAAAPAPCLPAGGPARGAPAAGGEPAEEESDKENVPPAPAASRGAPLGPRQRASGTSPRALREIGPCDGEEAAAAGAGEGCCPGSPGSDASDGESCCSDFESEELAAKLEERIWLNEGGRYDFEIYEDP
ncbi:unnamed protein product [Prorocentrum cordatum]|uniref:Uncharacterized protein n=1 Tax=Prorocentrum cordatum TaxID=2364126 RepID=A0ABN9W5E0_9DINO|nr:unnamed protein product [Polarella glacialis]